MTGDATSFGYPFSRGTFLQSTSLFETAILRSLLIRESFLLYSWWTDLLLDQLFLHRRPNENDLL